MSAKKYKSDQERRTALALRDIIDGVDEVQADYQESCNRLERKLFEVIEALRQAILDEAAFGVGDVAVDESGNRYRVERVELEGVGVLINRALYNFPGSLKTASTPLGGTGEPLSIIELIRKVEPVFTGRRLTKEGLHHKNSSPTKVYRHWVNETRVRIRASPENSQSQSRPCKPPPPPPPPPPSEG